MSDILNKYLEEASQDAALDVFTVKDVQSKLPAIKHKWVGRLIRAKQKLNSLRDQKDELKTNMMNLAKEKASYKVADNILEKSIAKSSNIIDIDKQIQEYRLIIDFLERTEKIFSSMTFDIKNLTEVMKIETL